MLIFLFLWLFCCVLNKRHQIQLWFESDWWIGFSCMDTSSCSVDHMHITCPDLSLWIYHLHKTWSSSCSFYDIVPTKEQHSEGCSHEIPVKLSLSYLCLRLLQEMMFLCRQLWKCANRTADSSICSFFIHFKSQIGENSKDNMVSKFKWMNSNSHELKLE